ncbi:hypothetical protein CWO91_22490 [Bradyrhizobium genosp. SA-3]|nr:hypothetical protein CWO91_22490 [Bradyrhizobium genosp. SA-3]
MQAPLQQPGPSSFETLASQAPQDEGIESALLSQLVMPGLDPGIHVLRQSRMHVDGRVKPGHDGGARRVHHSLSSRSCIPSPSRSVATTRCSLRAPSSILPAWTRPE